MQAFDSVLLVSFGGPEGPEDVMPFLENVLRGKNVPRQRMLEVADHYKQFGGISPINAQNRQLISHLQKELDVHGINLPIYWGNRNWHPLLPDTLRRMQQHGRRRSLAFFTSIFSSYSGCRQYRENIAAAQSTVGSAAPEIEKLRMGFNHPSFVEAQSTVVRASLEEFPLGERARTTILFTAHSIPLSMAENCQYEHQLREAARLVCENLNHPQWELVFQSRSGPPSQPWLEPDVCDRLEQLADASVQQVVIVPLGFISDHIEVLFDLDIQAKQTCERLGIKCTRAATVGVQPAFIRMIRELIQERLDNTLARQSLGVLGPSHDKCPENCCLYPKNPRGH